MPLCGPGASQCMLGARQPGANYVMPCSAEYEHDSAVARRPHNAICRSRTLPALWIAAKLSIRRVRQTKTLATKPMTKRSRPFVYIWETEWVELFCTSAVTFQQQRTLPGASFSCFITCAKPAKVISVLEFQAALMLLGVETRCSHVLGSKLR